MRLVETLPEDALDMAARLMGVVTQTPAVTVAQNAMQIAPYIKPCQHDADTLEAIKVMDSLQATERHGALAMLKAYAEHLGR
jgi:hypothetical protein